MEELYQIRVTRRQENDERRERRLARRAAREAGDTARLEQLRIQSRLAESALRIGGSAGSSSSSLPRDANTMLAEHQARAESRERKISSVSYADLGLARHDGSRIRADSVESDHRPLLDSAASMASSRRSSFALPLPRFGRHHRNASTGSVLSTDSDLGQGMTPITSHRSGSGSDPPILTPSATHGSNGSDREDVQPGENPPQYEDEEAPPYTSPIRSGAPQLPPLVNVPSIEVEIATPSNSVPATPVERNEHR
ncbi:MAG: hypothetical protein Q9226_006140 [Calogaya cf. arnoldii]